MQYFANPSTRKVRDAMTAGLLGAILTPAQGNRLPDRAAWIADNGCFGAGYPGDDDWLAWLRSKTRDAHRCVFATAPDIVADAPGTLARSEPHLPAIRSLGFPAALVAQDGLEELTVPWESFDALFIGGSTDWKLSAAASRLVREAKARGKWAHMGRVNSRRRWSYAEHIDCDSVDGTFLAFGPDRNLSELLGWLGQPALFGGAS